MEEAVRLFEERDEIYKHNASSGDEDNDGRADELGKLEEGGNLLQLKQRLFNRKLVDPEEFDESMHFEQKVRSLAQQPSTTLG